MRLQGSKPLLFLALSLGTGCGRVGFVALDAPTLPDRAISDGAVTDDRPTPVDASPIEDAIDDAIDDARDSADALVDGGVPMDAVDAQDAQDALDATAVSDARDDTNVIDVRAAADVADALDAQITIDRDARSDVRDDRAFAFDVESATDAPADSRSVILGDVVLSTDAPSIAVCDTAPMFAAPDTIRSNTCGGTLSLVPACAGVEAPTSYVALRLPAGRAAQVSVSSGFAIELQAPCGVRRGTCSTTTVALSAQPTDTVQYFAVSSTSRSMCGEFTVTAR